MARNSEPARRFGALVRGRREDDETAEELRFHLEMEAERNRRSGMDPGEARRRARLRLGGTDGIREAVRDARAGRSLEDLARDIGYAVRGLRRNPGFTIAAVVSLAIPIGFNTSVFTVVDSILFHPLPVVRPAQLVDVYSSHPRAGRYRPNSYPDYLDLRAANGVFTDMAAHAPMRTVVRVGEDVDLVMGEAVTGNYFQFLGVRPLLGRPLAPDDDRPAAARVAVISTGLWERAFGRDPAVVGRDLHIGSQPYVVIGVAPPAFYGMPPIPGGDVWIPMTWVDDATPVGTTVVVASPGETRLERRGERWMFIKGRLRDDVGLAQADANLDSIMVELAAAFPGSNEGVHVSLTETDDVRLTPDMAGPAYFGAATAMLMVGVVLLVACANVMGMLLARAGTRRREIGVRLAIGASRRRIVQQLLTETLVLSSFGAAMGLALAWTTMRVAGAVESPIRSLPYSFEFALHGRAFLFTAALAVGAGVLAGLVPALRATRLSLVREFSGAVAVSSAGGRRWFVRDVLVAAQLAVTVPLLVLAGLLGRGAVAATADASLEFDPDRVVAVSTDLEMNGYDPEREERFMRDALDRVRSIPGVEAAALASRAPLDAISYSTTIIRVPGLHGPADRGASIPWVAVSRGYFGTLGVPLLQGRTFTTGDTRESPRVAIASEAMALRFWPAGTAVGRRFRLGEPDGPEYEVVGVAADYKVRFPTEAPAPYLHVAASQHAQASAVLLARTEGDAAAPAADIRREFRRMEPDLFFFFQGDTLREIAAVTVLPLRIAASVSGAAGIVAMLLGAVGLYGVVAYLVLRRTREFAIRSALGARSASLVRLVLSTGAWVVGLGAGAGAVLAVVATRLASQVMPGVTPADPVVWGGALLLIAGVAAAAHVGPARRIMSLNLMQALHVE